jgi:hypothetical protein
MSDITQCPQCQRKLNVPEGQLGSVVRCPACGAEFTAESYAAPRSVPVAPEPEAPRRNYPPRDYDDDYDRPRRLRYDRGYDRPYYDGVPHRGSTVQTLGVLCLCLCWLFVVPWVLGIIALVMASSDLSQMDTGRMDPLGRSATKSGQVCAIIGIAVSLVLVFSCCGMQIIFRNGYWGW